MVRTVVKITGMMCGMCEAHVNDAIRSAFPGAKVTSSHRRGESVIISKTPPDPAALRRVIDATGYSAVSVTSEEAERKGLLERLFRR